MIFAASWAISARLYYLCQRFAPSNIVIRQVHTRTGIKWGPLVGLAGVALYGLLMLVTATVVRDGGPGWVDLSCSSRSGTPPLRLPNPRLSLVRLARVRWTWRSSCMFGPRASSNTGSDRTSPAFPTRWTSRFSRGFASGLTFENSLRRSTTRHNTRTKITSRTARAISGPCQGR
jgi:hypothetical protein